MDTKNVKQPDLWAQTHTVTGTKPENLEPLFFNKAYIENFFEKNISIAKELLRAENLFFDNVSIEFSTLNYCYIVKIQVENYIKFYNLNSNFLQSDPTANIKQAIESSIQKLKSARQTETQAQSKPEPKKELKTTPQKENKPEVKPENK